VIPFFEMGNFNNFKNVTSKMPNEDYHQE